MQTGCGPYPASYLMGLGVFFSGVKQPVRDADLSHFVLRLRMSGCLPPLRSVPSWRAEGRVFPYLVNRPHFCPSPAARTKSAHAYEVLFRAAVAVVTERSDGSVSLTCFSTAGPPPKLAETFFFIFFIYYFFLLRFMPFNLGRVHFHLLRDLPGSLFPTDCQ